MMRSGLRLGATCLAALFVAVMMVVGHGGVSARTALAQDVPAAEAEPAPSDDILATVPQGLTPEQIDAIVALLDDTQARQALRSALARLSERAAQVPPPEPPLAQARIRLADALAAIPALPSMIADAEARDAAMGFTTPLGTIALRTALVVLAGLAVGLFATRSLGGLERRIESRLTGGAAPVGRGLARLMADIAGIAAFAATVVVIYLILSPVHPRAPLLLQGMLILVSATWGVIALSRFLLAPGAAQRRWMPVSDKAAGAVHRAVVTLSTVGVIFALPILAIDVMALPAPALLASRLAFSLAVVITAIVLVWNHRLLIGGTLTRAGDEASAGLWGTGAALVMTLFLVGIWVLWTGAQLTAARSVAVEAGLSLLIIVLAPAAIRAMDRALPEARDHEGKEGTGHGLRRAVRVVLALAVVWLILAVWGVNFSQGDGAAAAVARIVFQGGVVVVLGYVGWLFLKGWLDRQIAKAQQAPVGSSVSRLATLLPLIRAFALTVVATMVILSVLSSFGINIGPLLAGAGVVGLAIGFGAQSLVADIVAGIFFLLDDAFRIGEYVEVGQTRGTVEGISLRSLKLRHHRGAVHTLPFGQIRQLTNYSRDWVIMKLEFRVPEDTDLALVKKLIKKIGAELSADETLGPSFLEPLKSQGVRRVEDDALIIGVKFMSKPGEQFSIRKEAYQRIVSAFRENGIELVAKGVTVKVDAAEHIDPKVAAAAAEQAIQGQAANTSGE